MSKTRTSKKKVIKFLERKANEYRKACVERSCLLRAVEVLKNEKEN